MTRKHILTLISILIFILAIMSDVFYDTFKHIKVGIFEMSSICYIIGFTVLIFADRVKDKE